MKKLFQTLGSILEISQGSNNRLRSIEGIRGVAVFLVFLVHYSSEVSPYVSSFVQPALQFVSTFGTIGVDLFFVLSGFLIYGSIMSGDSFSYRSFAKRRIQRIYPAFITVLAIYIFLSFIFVSYSKLPQDPSALAIYILQNLLLLPGIFPVEPIITVAWSLSYEVFYYLLIPPVIFCMKLTRWNVNTRIVFWGVISVLYIYLASHPLWTNHVDQKIHLVMFIAGILLYELYSVKKITLQYGGTRFLFIALAVFGVRSFHYHDFRISIGLIFLLFLLVCLCAFDQRSRAYKWLTFTPLRRLGNMSYSYYLIHALALKFCFLLYAKYVSASYISSSVYFWLWIPCFAATLIASFVLFYTVERPFSLNTKTPLTPKSSDLPQTQKSLSQ